MKVPWAYQRCVLCLRGPDPEDEGSRLTWAHIVPKSVGGKLEVKFLCSYCNSVLGHTVEKGLKADPSIASCIQAILSRLSPSLRKKLLAGMSWMADTGTGSLVEGRLDEKGRFSPSERSDFLSYENAKAMLESRWQEMGLAEHEAAEHRAVLDAKPSTAFVHLPKGSAPVSVDPSALTPEPDWSGDLIPNTLPLSIAFSYLCFYLGSTAYKSHELQPVREALLTNDSSESDHWEVDPRINRAGCAPIHRLRIKELAPIVIHVELFHQWAWWVKFPKIGLREEPPGHYGVDISAAESGEFVW